MVVVIDNYDSFTYNLVDYIGKLGVGATRVVRNDALSVEGIAALAPSFIVISPGPKAPAQAAPTAKGDTKAAATALKAATVALDSAVSKGVLHRSTASRSVSRLNLAVNKIAAKQ